MSDLRDPRSLNDREYASFATTGDKKRTARRVVGLDGEPVAAGLEDLITEAVMELRAIRRGLEIVTGESLLTDD
jgi:hypothetical protein